MKQDVIVDLAGGKQIKFETGRMAKQASGAALTSSGDNVILATAVASPGPERRNRFLSADRGVSRVHLCGWTDSGRLHQA